MMSHDVLNHFCPISPPNVGGDGGMAFQTLTHPQLIVFSFKLNLLSTM